MSCYLCKVRCGVRTVVKDRRSGTSLTQVCVGRVSDCTKPCPWPVTAGVIGDRITYSHSPIYTPSDVEEPSSPGEARERERGERFEGSEIASRLSEGGTRVAHNDRSALPLEGLHSKGSHGGGEVNKPSYALISIQSEPLEGRADAVLVQPGTASDKRCALEYAQDTGDVSDPLHVKPSLEQERQQSRKPQIILGPVVGKVEVVRQSGVVRESCRVPVLLEVDRTGVVSCVVSKRSCEVCSLRFAALNTFKVCGSNIKYEVEGSTSVRCSSIHSFLSDNDHLLQKDCMITGHKRKCTAKDTRQGPFTKTRRRTNVEIAPSTVLPDQ